MNFARPEVARGAGLGSVFGTLFRAVSPLVKRLVSSGSRVLRSKAVKSLARDLRQDAVSSGLKLASQALSGENIGKAAKENVKSFGKKAASRTTSAIAKAIEQEPEATTTQKQIRRRGRAPRGKNKKRRRMNYAPGSTQMSASTRSAKSADIFDSANN